MKNNAKKGNSSRKFLIQFIIIYFQIICENPPSIFNVGFFFFGRLKENSKLQHDVFHDCFDCLGQFWGVF